MMNNDSAAPDAWDSRDVRRSATSGRRRFRQPLTIEGPSQFSAVLRSSPQLRDALRSNDADPATTR